MTPMDEEATCPDGTGQAAKAEDLGTGPVADTSLAEEFLDALSALGVPMFTLREPEGTEQDDKSRFPSGWQKSTVANNPIMRETARTTHGLNAVLGGRVAVVDVDTKNKADLNSVRTSLDDSGVQIFAEIETPSGGRHYYVAAPPTGLATKHEIDLTGVEILSNRANVFLPGTSRVAYEGKGYKVLTNDLSKLSNDNGSAFAAWSVRHTLGVGSQRRPAPTTPVVPPPTAPTATLSPWASSARARELGNVTNAPEGSRNSRLNESAYSLGQLVGGGELPRDETRAVLLDAARETGLGDAEALATIDSGLRSGMENPRSKPVEFPNGIHLDLGEIVEDDVPSSWAPTDLARILTGDYEQAKPTLFPRSDGICLLYPGLTHSFHGESESGKSLLAQIESIRIIESGGRVLYLDFESDAASVTMRLKEFGATSENIIRGFTYLNPEVKPNAGRDLEAWNSLLSGKYDLAVIDGVTDALGIWGCSTQDNDDVSRWSRDLPDQLARKTGAAVLMIDHVTKSTEGRGRFAIGAQSKIAGLTGAAYTVEIQSPLGRGLVGTIVLRIAKDRPGYVRGHGGEPRSDRTQEVARVTVDSQGGAPEVTISGPEDQTDVRESKDARLLEALSRAIEGVPEGLSGKAIREAVMGRTTDKLEGLQRLAAEGYVEVMPGPRGAQLHVSIRPYRNEHDMSSEALSKISF